MEFLQTLGPLPMFILMFFVLYFVLIRPQIKDQRGREAMLKNLKKDDRVVTKGGIIGKIQDFQGKNDQYVIIDNETGVKIKVLKNYISSLIEK